MTIKRLHAREILDSRANPTVECFLELENDICVKASVPSGASVGRYEAVELRDGDQKRYFGKGVLSVIENIEKKIAPALIGQAVDLEKCDKIMCDLDGTSNKSVFGANAILPVSIAVLRAQAALAGLPLYKMIEEILGISPQNNVNVRVMFNILNGGVHAMNGICFQEFMIMPMRRTFSDKLHLAASVYHTLKNILVEEGYSVGVGDEGGFAPIFSRSDIAKSSNLGLERKALDLLQRAIQKAGYVPGEDVLFCLDAAASQFFSKDENAYALYNKIFSAKNLIDEYKQLIDDYPIYLIEDALDEDDWEGWKVLTQELGKNTILVGDDIFVSNPLRIKSGIEKGIANSVLIKPNQIGTVSEVLQAIKICKENNYSTVVSHRSGETNDSFIADLAVGTNSQFLKAGAPARGERVAKYNRLLEIENS